VTDLERKTHLRRLRAKVEVVLGAVGFLEQSLEDAARAGDDAELAADLVLAEGWAIEVVQDTREVLGEASALRAVVAETTEVRR
jgi:hypothetical protein